MHSHLSFYFSRINNFLISCCATIISSSPHHNTFFYSFSLSSIHFLFFSIHFLFSSIHFLSSFLLLSPLLFSALLSSTLFFHPLSSHLELQQRACEYLALPSVGSEIMEAVLNSMPPYIDKCNALLSLHEVK